MSDIGHLLVLMLVMGLTFGLWQENVWAGLWMGGMVVTLYKLRT